MRLYENNQMPGYVRRVPIWACVVTQWISDRVTNVAVSWSWLGIRVEIIMWATIMALLVFVNFPEEIPFQVLPLRHCPSNSYKYKIRSCFLSVFFLKNYRF